MRFTSTILYASALLSSAVSGAAIEKRALSAHQLSIDIKNITQEATALTKVVSSIMTVDSGVTKRQLNPFMPVVQGLNVISQNQGHYAENLTNAKAYPSQYEKTLCSEYSTYIDEAQKLIKKIIGKSGLLESVYAGPVAASLRQYESSFDEFSFNLIDTTPNCEAASTKKKDALDENIDTAICVYTPGGFVGTTC